MTALIGFAANLLGPEYAKFAKPIVYVLLGLLILGAMWGGKCAYDKHVIDQYEAKITQHAQQATDQAATERGNDAVTNAKQEQELHNVIAAQPDQPISPTSRALACERLRRAGRNPPACR